MGFTPGTLTTLNLQTQYGAIGDGSTDNATAWANCIADARLIVAQFGGCNIYVPPGVYYSSATIAASTLAGARHDAITIIGAGRFSTVLSYTGTGTALQIELAQSMGVSVLQKWGLENLRVYHTGTAGIALSLIGTDAFSMINVSLAAGNGAQAWNCQANTNTQYMNCEFNGGGGTPAASKAMVEISNAGAHGGNANIQGTNNIYEDSVSTLINISAAPRTSLVGERFSSGFASGGDCAVLGASSQGSSLTGCTMQTAGVSSENGYHINGQGWKIIGGQTLTTNSSSAAAGITINNGTSYSGATDRNIIQGHAVLGGFTHSIDTNTTNNVDIIACDLQGATGASVAIDNATTRMNIIGNSYDTPMQKGSSVAASVIINNKTLGSFITITGQGSSTVKVQASNLLNSQLAVALSAGLTKTNNVDIAASGNTVKWNAALDATGSQITLTIYSLVGSPIAEQIQGISACSIVGNTFSGGETQPNIKANITAAGAGILITFTTIAAGVAFDITALTSGDTIVVALEWVQ